MRFYKDLYTSQNLPNQSYNNTQDENIKFFHDPIDKQLSNESRIMLEKDITKEEVAKALKKMPNNKSCLLYTSPSPRDRQKSRMPSSA